MLGIYIHNMKDIGMADPTIMVEIPSDTLAGGERWQDHLIFQPISHRMIG